MGGRTEGGKGESKREGGKEGGIFFRGVKNQETKKGSQISAWAAEG